MTDRNPDFETEVQANIAALGARHELWPKTLEWMLDVGRSKYTYNFTWLGRPIIQYPQDMIALQEIIWRVQPDIIIETGIAHGGSLVFSASMLMLLDILTAGHGSQTHAAPRQHRRVIGVDVDIRTHNREAIANHPLAGMITMLQGSSTACEIISEVIRLVGPHDRVLVCLDSDHTREHVAAELAAYAPLVTDGSYLVVYDTVVEEMPPEFRVGKSWGPGNSPLTAIKDFLATNGDFEADTAFDHKLQITVARGGYLRRIKGNHQADT